MKRLLCLLTLAALTFQSGEAAPAVTGFVSVHGGFSASGGPQNSSKPAGAPGQAKTPTTTGFPSGPFPTGTGPICVTNPQVISPCIIVPGCGTTYTNYQVISPSVTYYSSSDAAYYYYIPAPPAPVATAPAASAIPVALVDSQGLIHSPYSKAVVKVTSVVNGQTVHDPLTGQAFRVQIAGAARVTASTRPID